jgi:hypothetical protein
LRSVSPRSLRAALLYETAQSCSWNELSEFARRGKQTGFVARNSALRTEAAECLASAVVAKVVAQIPAPPTSPVLVIGFGHAGYFNSLAQRWPEVAVYGWNPFSAEHAAAPTAEFGTVILSGILDWCSTADFQKLLTQIRTKAGGVLIVQDALLPVGVQPTPQAALRALARQVADGNAHAWSVDRLLAALQRAGFDASECTPLLGDGALIIAHRSEIDSINTTAAALAAHSL